MLLVGCFFLWGARRALGSPAEWHGVGVHRLCAQRVIGRACVICITAGWWHGFCHVDCLCDDGSSTIVVCRELFCWRSSNPCNVQLPSPIQHCDQRIAVIIHPAPAAITAALASQVAPPADAPVQRCDQRIAVIIQCCSHLEAMLGGSSSCRDTGPRAPPARPRPKQAKPKRRANTRTSAKPKANISTKTTTRSRVVGKCKAQATSISAAVKRKKTASGLPVPRIVKEVRRTAARPSKEWGCKHHLLAEFHQATLTALTAAPGKSPVNQREGPVVRVGADCVGLGTECLALTLNRIQWRLVFCSEIDPVVFSMHRKLHTRGPEAFHSDLCKRTTPLPEVDLYVAGFPCQAWSSAGVGLGVRDAKGRGVVIYHILQQLAEAQQKPRCVILENVKGLAQRHPHVFSDVLAALSNMQYQTTWAIQDTSKHGLPHSRPRLYIIGIQRAALTHTFRFPKPLNTSLSLDSLLDHRPPPPSTAKLPITARDNIARAKQKFAAQNIDMDTRTCMIDVFASKRFASSAVDKCVCITASRGLQGGYYISNQSRMTSVAELGRLQGMPTRWLQHCLCSDVDRRRLGGAVGNSMSVNVLSRIVPRALYCAGVLPQLAEDNWKRASPGVALDSMYPLPPDAEL